MIYKWALAYILWVFVSGQLQVTSHHFHNFTDKRETMVKLFIEVCLSTNCLHHYGDQFCLLAPLLEMIDFSCRVVRSKKICILLSIHERDLGRAITSLVALKDHNIPHYPLFSALLPSYPHSLLFTQFSLMASCEFEVRSWSFCDLIGWNVQRVRLECVWIHVWVRALPGHSNDAQRDSLRGPTHFQHRRRGEWRAAADASANRKRNECELGRFLLQFVLSASGSQSTTTSIFHMRRSQCAGAAGVCVIAGCLHRVCICMCVYGWGIIYGKTTKHCHLANIWTSAPHLTVRIEAAKITQCLICTSTHI